MNQTIEVPETLLPTALITIQDLTRGAYDASDVVEAPKDDREEIIANRSLDPEDIAADFNQGCTCSVFVDCRCDALEARRQNIIAERGAVQS